MTGGCANGQHRFFRSADGTEWVAPVKERPRYPEQRPPGSMVIKTMYAGGLGKPDGYQLAVREKHRDHDADIAEYRRLVAHPSLRPPRWQLAFEEFPDARSLIDRFAGWHQTIRRVGGHVTVTCPDTVPSWHQEERFIRIGRGAHEIIKAYEPLLLAELGGWPVECDIDRCTRGATTLLMGGAVICRQHYEVGPDGWIRKPIAERVAGAGASVLGG